MSFWNLSNGAEAQKTTSFESTTDMEPIPAKTVCKAIVSDAKWSSYNGDEYIDLAWKIIDGFYKNRMVFQKVRVKDVDPKKADKAKNMLAAIATNAGGGLFGVNREPTDADLTSHLTMKPMAIKLGVWAIEDKETGETKRGNWVQAVSDSSTADTATPNQPKPASNDADDDIPF